MKEITKSIKRVPLKVTKVFSFFEFLALFFLFLQLSACSSTETTRDPSRRGFLLAEQMIDEGRFHDGLLMHRVNAKFFSTYPYAKKSAQRIENLNELLKKSVKGRPEIEVIKKKIEETEAGIKVLLTIVNNTEEKISSFELRIQALNAYKRPMLNRITRQYAVTEQSSKSLGAWDINIFVYEIPGFRNVKDLKVTFRNIIYDKILSIE